MYVFLHSFCSSFPNAKKCQSSLQNPIKTRKAKVLLASNDLVIKHRHGKIHPFLSSVNHLFQWAIIFHGYVSHNQRVYPINIPLNHYRIPLNHYKSRGQIPWQTVSHNQRVIIIFAVNTRMAPYGSAGPPRTRFLRLERSSAGNPRSSLAGSISHG